MTKAQIRREFKAATKNMTEAMERLERVIAEGKKYGEREFQRRIRKLMKRSNAADKKRSREVKNRLAAYQKRVAAFTKRHPDFLEVVDGIGDVPMSPVVHGTILDSEVGPEMIYKLAENPTGFAKLCKAKQITALRKLIKIEQKIVTDVLCNPEISKKRYVRLRKYQLSRKRLLNQ